MFSAARWYPDTEGLPGVKFDETLKVHFVITKRQQRYHLKPGDWLIWDERGHHLPVRDEAFKRQYEVVGEETGDA